MAMSQSEPDPGSSCLIRPPQHAARLLPPAAQRPFDVATWSSANVTALQCPCRNASCPKIFQPCGSRSYNNGDWDEAIRSSQFPAKCDRFLLVKIDLPNAGLGMLSRVLASALLLAVRENRVLIEVPLNGSTELPHGAFHLGRAPGKGMTSSPPWCDRAPYTMQCFYLPWTHCSVPDEAYQHRARGVVVDAHRTWVHEPVVATSIMRLYVQPTRKLWTGVPSSAMGAAIRFLFRPRPWVQEIGDCVMRRSQLMPGGFASVHVRDSPEKRAEAKKLGKRLPGFEDYWAITHAAGRHVHLQTANGDVVHKFTSRASLHRMGLGYTVNSRPEHDSWGGKRPGEVMEQSITAAVNAYIGSRACLFFSPAISMWTNFITPMMGAGDRSAPVCCRCSTDGNSGGFIRVAYSRGCGMNADEIASLVKKSACCTLTPSRSGKCLPRRVPSMGNDTATGTR